MKTGTFLVGLTVAILGASAWDSAFAGSVFQRAPATAPATSTPGTVEIVSVTGCLKEQGPDNWMLVSATDPVASIANAPQKSEYPTTPPAGKNEYKLIGVSEFDLPTHKDHTVVVKGLFIKAMPVSRVNMTSIVTALTSCAPTPAK